MLRTLLAADFAKRLRGVKRQVRCLPPTPGTWRWAQRHATTCNALPKWFHCRQFLHRTFDPWPLEAFRPMFMLTVRHVGMQSVLLCGLWPQLDEELVIEAFRGLMDFTAFCRYKRGMLHAALRYFRLNRQRAALHSLRWNVMRRRLKRAVAMRGRMGAVGKAMQVRLLACAPSSPSMPHFASLLLVVSWL